MGRRASRRAGRATIMSHTSGYHNATWNVAGPQGLLDRHTGLFLWLLKPKAKDKNEENGGRC